MAEYPVNVIENAFCSTEEKQTKQKATSPWKLFKITHRQI